MSINMSVMHIMPVCKNIYMIFYAIFMHEPFSEIETPNSPAVYL